MDLEAYIDHNAWWWARCVRKGADHDYIWYRIDEDGKPIKQMLDAFRFMHGRLDKQGKMAVKAAGTHKAMVRQTILEYEKTEYFKPQQLWADTIQTEEDPVSGVRMEIV